MNKLKVLVLCFCAFVFIFNLSVASADDAAEYTKRLSEFLTYFNKQGITEAALEPYYNKLLAFSDEYPSSRFADDAIYMIKMIEFMSSTTNPNKYLSFMNAQIQSMEEFVKKYPGGKIEDLTVTTAHKSLGEGSFGIMLYIPYKYLVEYMKANKALEMKDYSATAELYSSLKKELEDVIKNDANLAAEIYLPLFVGLRRQGKSAEEKQLFEEVFQRYPGTRLESSFRGFQKQAK